MTNFQANELVQKQWAKWEATHGCVDQHPYQAEVVECLINGTSYCIIDDVFYQWDTNRECWWAHQVAYC